MNTDVVIIGGGPAGAGTALHLEKLGVKSLIIEKKTFPRYHIGESLTGECGKCVRELGLEDKMNLASHPVKRGVKVFGPNGDNSFYVPTMGRDDQGELFSATTWSVRRSEFDKMLLDAAEERGTAILKGQAVEPLIDESGKVCGIRYRNEQGEEQAISAKVVVDASGSATFMSNQGVAGSKSRGSYDKQIAIFSQVRGAIRDDAPYRDDTLIFYKDTNHWAWFIPLDDDVVSVGTTVSSEYFTSSNLSKTDFLAAELKSLNPELARRVENLEFEEEVRAISNYSYEVSEYTGNGYLCVGDAHRFVDPIFSYGVYFSLKESKFAASAISDYLQGLAADEENPFAAYQELCNRGQDSVQALIDGFWNYSFAFAFFVHTRYVDDFIDLFSGRVYSDAPNRGLEAIHALERKSREMEAGMAVG